MTVLANEQVIDGKGWRSGAPVERRKCRQWFLKITDFAEELLEGLGTLDQWPDKVRLMQENWIGKSRGLQFRFRLAGDAPGGASATSRCSRPGPTRSSAPASSLSRPATRSPRRSPRERSRGRRRSSTECRAGGTTAAEIETAEKLGFDTGLEVVHPLDPRLAPAGVDRQFRADGLWHRRDLRRARRTTRATSSSRPNMTCRSAASSPPTPTAPAPSRRGRDRPRRRGQFATSSTA